MWASLDAEREPPAVRHAIQSRCWRPRARRAASLAGAQGVLDALHVHTVEAAISAASPVRGLCPRRALRVQP